MDSGSGSLQSSSGADEEYDSHHQQQHQAPLFPPPSIFFNPNIPPPSIPPPPPHHHQHQQQPQQQFPFHLSHHNYQQPSSTNLLYDFPSDEFNLQQPPSNFNPSDSSFLKYPTSLRSDDHHHHQPTQNPTTPTPPTPPTNPSPSSINLHPKSTAKKRTRASRRAPTTVLTTDTTNFRAMVQEFTGIPSPPFTATGSTSSSSRRFDLFGSGSGLGLYNPSWSTTKVVQVMNTNNNNVVVESMEDENALRNFSFHESAVVTESTHLEPRSQQLLSVLQNDITAWRPSGNDADTTAQTAAAAAARSIINYNNAAPNCKFNFTDSSSSSNLLQLQRDHKDILLGNIVVSTTTTTRGETTVVNSWIYPSD